MSVAPQAALVIQIGHVRYQLKAEDMQMGQRILLSPNSQSSRRCGGTNMGVLARFVLQVLFQPLQHKSDQLDAATSKVVGFWSILESLPNLYGPGFLLIPHMTC